jgi:hypothetical protein
MLKELIDNKDYQGIADTLIHNPSLANEAMSYSNDNAAKAHPLHRICDGVFLGKYTDEEAVQMAKIFLENGADINGGELIEKQDTPLIAAASLYADQVAICYLAHGANIHHAGCYGGTALHWAAWCGRVAVVRALIEHEADLNKRFIDFEATPLFWSVQGYKNGGNTSKEDYLACIRLLLQAEANKNIPNMMGKIPFDLLDNSDTDFKEILSDLK